MSNRGGDNHSVRIQFDGEEEEERLFQLAIAESKADAEASGVVIAVPDDSPTEPSSK